MIEDIEKQLIESNLKFKWKIMQDLESVEIQEDIPKYPVLILTCMDPRIDVYRIFQLNPGDIFILRNAGNIYTQDMLRSILITIFKYGIKYIIILGHLDCGMTKINIPELRKKLPSKFLSRLSSNYSELFRELTNFFKPFDNEVQNVLDQIKTLEIIKVFYPEIEITGMLYDVKTGLVFEYEKFKDYRSIEDFREMYREILIEKKSQFTEFLAKIKTVIPTFEDSKESSRESESKEVVISTVVEKNEEKKDTPDIEPEEYKRAFNNNIQTIIPKITVPKIKFQGVKIYIPKRFSERKEKF